MPDVYNKNYTLLFGDCIDRMSELLSDSVNLVLQDPPYGSTELPWDSVLSLDELWECFDYLTVARTAILLFGKDPFKSILVNSNLANFRYNIYWNTQKAANFLFGNKRPLQKIEPISVFYRKQPVYNPRKLVNPNGEQQPDRKAFGNTIYEHIDHLPTRKVKSNSYESDKLLPDDVIDDTDLDGLMLPFSKPQKPLHPTQKPVPLLRYLIETYSNPDDLVLDATMGSGSTGVACLLSGRRFIGIENDPGYFAMATDRMNRVANGDLEMEKGFSKDVL